MLPLLSLLANGQPWTSKQLRERLADDLQLSSVDRHEMLPSGRQERFTNRVAWALVHLKAARVIASPARATYVITERGLEVLAEAPERIDLKYLLRFPEYVEFRSPNEAPQQKTPAALEEQSPEELMETTDQALRKDLAAQLLAEIKDCSPAFFERLVVELLLAMGYGGSMADAGTAVGQSGDGGIDGIIKEDRLGLDAVYIQAKRWEGSVGGPVVQGFAGSLEGKRASKGVMISTSQFTKAAHDYVGNISKRIVLIDGEKLAELMIEHGIGVTEVARYSVKRVDSDYFVEE
jgi:restriction system protein